MRYHVVATKAIGVRISISSRSRSRIKTDVIDGRSDRRSPQMALFHFRVHVHIHIHRPPHKLPRSPFRVKLFRSQHHPQASNAQTSNSRRIACACIPSLRQLRVRIDVDPSRGSLRSWPWFGFGHGFGFGIWIWWRTRERYRSERSVTIVTRT
jgi:hypothetical protein